MWDLRYLLDSSLRGQVCFTCSEGNKSFRRVNISISAKGSSMSKTTIEIRPHRGGWQVFEGSGVQPYFGDRKHAVDYAIGRAKMRKGEIRILDADGELLETFPFDDSG